MTLQRPIGKDPPSGKLMVHQAPVDQASVQTLGVAIIVVADSLEEALNVDHVPGAHFEHGPPDLASGFEQLGICKNSSARKQQHEPDNGLPIWSYDPTNIFQSSCRNQTDNNNYQILFVAATDTSPPA